MKGVFWKTTGFYYSHISLVPKGGCRLLEKETDRQRIRRWRATLPPDNYFHRWYARRTHSRLEKRCHHFQERRRHQDWCRSTWPRPQWWWSHMCTSRCTHQAVRHIRHSIQVRTVLLLGLLLLVPLLLVFLLSVVLQWKRIQYIVWESSSLIEMFPFDAETTGIHDNCPY